MKNEISPLRIRLSGIVEVGNGNDLISRGYDFLGVFMIVLNLIISVAGTFDSLSTRFYHVFSLIESLTVAFFAVDFALRIWSAHAQTPSLSEGKSILCYILSFAGLVDLLSFLPYYLPVFFPSGAVAFRMFRVVRIFRLFRINAYYDSLNVITEVIVGKRQQLLSSVFIILTLMLASSLCMYSLEHEAQPQVFSNAFSGIWWSVSTLLTVGYGDIYPITTLGKIFSILITFLGVGMVAIPTGIISAGFVDQYTRVKRLDEYGNEVAVRFLKVVLHENDSWVGKAIHELQLPLGMIAAVIWRDHQILVPRGDILLQKDDVLVLGAEAFQEDRTINLKEITLGRSHPWNNVAIRDLDISRKTFLVLVRRQGEVIIPRGDLVLAQGDVIVLYSQGRLEESRSIPI